MEKQPKVPSTWETDQQIRRDINFSYDDPQLAPNPHQFELDPVRSAPAFMPNFLPNFGFPLSDFDYRLNDFPTSGLFGTYNIAKNPLPPSSAPSSSLQSFPSISLNPLRSTHDPVLSPSSQPTNITPLNNSVIHHTKMESIAPQNIPSDEHEKSRKSDDQSDRSAFRRTLIERQSFNDKFGNQRLGDDILFTPPFYGSQLQIDMSSSIKSEPPILDNYRAQKYSPPYDCQVNVNTSRKPKYTNPCQVCLSTHANGLHFGARTCAACAAFFRRTISDDKRYVCKRNQRCNSGSREGNGYRKICRSCRMKRCLEAGMMPEKVQITAQQAKRSQREPSPPPPSIKPQFEFFPTFYSNIQHTN